MMSSPLLIRFTFFLLSFMCTGSLFAQKPLGNLFPDLEKESLEMNLPIYKNPSGTQAGFVQIDTSGYWVRARAYRITDNDTIDIPINHQDIAYEDYERNFLKYYNLNGEYAHILIHSTTGGYWISVDRLEVIPWIEKVTQYSGYLVEGYNNYRLRSSPSLNSEIVASLFESFHSIKSFTGRIEGSWAEAVVVEIDTTAGVELESCYSLDDYTIVKEWTGWLKIVGDRGEEADIGHNISC